MKVVTLLFLVCFLLPSTSAIQFRYVYTLFETRKTWNEAKTICEDQLGQLVKVQNISDNHHIVRELQYLDNIEWNDAISNGNGFWNGLHKVNATMWKYQDCEEYGNVNLTQNVPTPNDALCSISDENYILNEVECNEEYPFICQRYIGDCWYEPFRGAKVLITNNDNIFTPDPTECARQCNNNTNSANDCWAFQFYPELGGGMCILEFHTETTYYMDPSIRSIADDPGHVLYIRRCFEGLEDTKPYSSIHYTDNVPLTDCDNRTYDGGPEARHVCFCTIEEQPPIPAPLSNADIIEKLIEELTLDASNTSSAVRKLKSAEDNRPSAVGVGLVGVGMLAGVFGSLLFLDIGRFIRGIKAICQSKPEQTES